MRMQMVSHSRMSMYDRCPQSVKFRYIDKVYTNAKPHPAAERGKDVHQTIEDYLTGTAKKVHEDVRQWLHIFAHVKAQAPFVEEKLAVNSQWRNSTWEGDKARIIGVVDCAYIDGDRIEVQEWKTGKMYDEHKDQRRLYAALSMARWPASRWVNVTSYYLDLGMQKSIQYAHDQLDPVRKDFNARIKAMEVDDILAPRPGWYCKWCPYSRFASGPCEKG